MSRLSAITLKDIGWDEFFAAQLDELIRADAQIGAIKLGEEAAAGEYFVGRVSRHDGQEYDVITAGESGLMQRRARLGGVLRYRAERPQDLPAVGDWVVMQADPGRLQTIVWVFKRRAIFVRQSAGQVTDEQIIATNIDTVFIVTSMNNEFEARRLERYLVAVGAAGAEAVIVLNKADLAEDPEAYIERAKKVADDTPVVSIAALPGEANSKNLRGAHALKAWLKRGETVVFVGSSGVGKSTIVNQLVGAEIQLTAGVRESDARGRHTTTTRQLLVLPAAQGDPAPSAAVLIDTPGMREFQLWAHDDDALDAFDDIAELESACRFRNCLHQREPGCAVQAALEAGTLTQERLASWHKLQEELAEQKQRQEVAARRARRAKNMKKR